MVDFSKYLMPSPEYTPVLQARQFRGKGLLFNWTFRDFVRACQKKFLALMINSIGTAPITTIGLIIIRPLISYFSRSLV